MARSVRGIEELVAAEIGRRGGEVVATGHREVRFVAPRAAGRATVASLATVDDVFVLVADVEGIGRSRADLPRLAAAVAAADLDAALAVRVGCGGPPGAAVDVSASFLGRRSFTRYDVEDAVGAALAARLDLPYHSRRGGGRPPEGGLSWRVTLVDDRASVAVRVGARPLHRRPWKVASVPGTLHPPLAAAMVALAGVGRGDVVLDPCCGAGTLAIEAARAGAVAVGADLDPAAVAASVRNGRASGVRWLRADAGALPVADGSVRRVLLNPPWGRRVAPAGVLARRPGRLGREVRRVLGPGGTAVALVPDGAAPEVAGLRVERRVPVALAGSRLALLLLR
ncbi:TRM11 family SAM-dependent methyltransferase [Pseudonocardia humida]|uniref:TRM11 family SAM-dependent methyltransferase n=1 Tax=Pseudonocardia humida TaxID=2800819 RepID=UPI0027E2FD0A|nr:methyltransferase domain-containing protein [Pseudonocardia humida]